MIENYWYKNIIVYAIDIKSYFDSNGDGIGDLEGVIEKLPYLSSLGVNCLWLLPFYPSPLLDNGYDVTDYYQVDSRVGSLDSFQRLVIKAAEKGIRIIIDIVMNHTSDRHPWFIASTKSSSSVFKDYYIWRKLPPIDSDDLPAFPGAEDELWKFSESAHAYYYHKFYHFQPDLNISNPIVREEINKVLDFWFSFGISGVRLDAVPVMLQSKGGRENHSIRPSLVFTKMRETIEKINPHSILVGEVDVDGNQLVDYFSDGKGLQLIFNFILNAYLIGAIVEMKAEILIQGWRELPVIPESGGWLNFLRNLDELNLYQLPKNLRHKVFSKIAPESSMRIYDRGVRRRLGSILNGDQKRIEMSMSLLFSLPGTPMIVYGDEIGMGDNLELWERESVRTPMQWSADEWGGFSQVKDEGSLFRKLVREEAFSFKKINVNESLGRKESLLHSIKKIIELRKRHPEIGLGRVEWVSVSHPGVLAHVCHWKNCLLLVIHNLSNEKIDTEMNFKTFFAKDLISILGEAKIVKTKNGIYKLNLLAFEYGWFRLELSPKEISHE